MSAWEVGRGCRLNVLILQGEAVYTVSSLRLHISENDQQILSSLGPSQRAQGKEDWRGQEGGTACPVPSVLISLPLPQALSDPRHTWLCRTCR